MLTGIKDKENKRPLCGICNNNISNTTYGLCRTCNINQWNKKHSIEISQIDPNEPTNYPPGSFEKLLVLCARANARLPLFNPLDYSPKNKQVNTIETVET